MPEDDRCVSDAVVAVLPAALLPPLPIPGITLLLLWKIYGTSRDRLTRGVGLTIMERGIYIVSVRVVVPYFPEVNSNPVPTV
jgi:hypothetical protein